MPDLHPSVREALTNAEVTRNHVKIREQLPRPVYEAVDAALQAIGGKYNRHARAHVFDTDPTGAIAQILASGDVPLPARTADGFVATPPAVATKLVDVYSDLLLSDPGVRVLEPSAGDGALLRAILDAQPKAEVWAVEPDRERAHKAADVARLMVEPTMVWEKTSARRAAMPAPGSVTVVRSSLEEFAAQRVKLGKGAPVFDVVVMNPPFSVPGNDALWVDHVNLVWDMLAPGGRLAAIVSRGYVFRQDKKHVAVRALIEEHGGCWEDLPDNTFAVGRAKAGFRTGIIYATKPTAPPAPMGRSAPAAAPKTAPAVAETPRLPYLFRDYREPIEPVRVEEPVLTWDAAKTMPAQVVYVSWLERDRVLLHLAKCATCPEPVWGWADGDHEAGDLLGVHSCAMSLWAESEGRQGPAIALCVSCGSDGAKYDQALKLAEPLWTDRDDEDTPDVEPATPAYDGREVLQAAQVPVGAYVAASGVDASGRPVAATGYVKSCNERRRQAGAQPTWTCLTLTPTPTGDGWKPQEVLLEHTAPVYRAPVPVRPADVFQQVQAAVYQQVVGPRGLKGTWTLTKGPLDEDWIFRAPLDEHGREVIVGRAAWTGERVLVTVEKKLTTVTGMLYNADTQIAEALTTLGLPVVASGAGRERRYEIGGRSMLRPEAANFLLAGGYDAAIKGGPVVVHPDRLAGHTALQALAGGPAPVGVGVQVGASGDPWEELLRLAVQL
ncbi:class I SAM-dependent methyltransferase [Micromonospora sp. C51]|uniref:class I SAM-dependent methyltransferase n=1 Tax=Micromonospora sp. C51 TaxID=2824879 RepID=UPI001B371A5D|nr:class I SAM-dependent methyltransferase [Micromonospora sp. C51]MBQ1048471.1 class I SAM-dependent methyltransferase [Micromonospora sp. C51]